MYKLDKPTKTEHAILLYIWEDAVKATHQFLAKEDIAFYKKMIQEKEAFDVVQLTCVRNPNNEVLGFMGVADDKLEMLFIRSDVRGKGIGKILLQHALEALKVKKVDVNEQNEQALSFYKHFGFQVVSRSPLDGAGKAYPILHLTVI